VLMHFIGPYLFNGGLPHIIFWISNFLAPISVIPLIAKRMGRTKHDMLAPITPDAGWADGRLPALRIR